MGAIILMIGMAVGIDYSLFYLRREREERQRGHSPHEALLRAARTSGQAVLISGATVLIAMAGMFVSGNSLFSTIGLGTMIVVLAAMIGSLTVLPAVLHRLGDRVDFGRDPDHPVARARRRPVGPLHREGAPASRDRAALSAGGCSVLALPAFQMHTKLPNLTDLPARPEDRRDIRAHPARLPGLADAAQVVVVGRRGWTRRRCTALTTCSGNARVATGELFTPFTVIVNPDKTVALIDFAIAGDGDNAASERALHTLRKTVIPSDREDLPDAEVAVTGVTAGTHDFNEQMRSRLPYVFMFVLGLAFVLLLLTFRSLVIAATAVASTCSRSARRTGSSSRSSSTAGSPTSSTSRRTAPS